jgi:hypothetical protein
VARTTLVPPFRPPDGFGVRGKLADVGAASTVFSESRNWFGTRLLLEDCSTSNR